MPKGTYIVVTYANYAKRYIHCCKVVMSMLMFYNVCHSS